MIVNRILSMFGTSIWLLDMTVVGAIVWMRAEFIYPP
jgi:hypothetical protein